MAKKSKKRSKKSSSKGSKKAAPKKSQSAGLPEGFWRQVFVVVLILLAVLLTFGAIGTGGAVATGLFDVTRWSLGYIAFAAPAIFLFSAIQKQRSDDYKLPGQIFAGLVVLILASTGFAHLFVDVDMSAELASDGLGGGMIGHIVASGMLTLFNSLLSGILLAVLVIVALHFVLRLPLTTFLRMLRVEKKRQKEAAEEGGDSDDSPAEEDEPHFTLNQGVPLQTKRLSSLKNTAEKLTDAESHVALTTASDPEWKFPSVDLLNKKQDKADAGDINHNADIIKQTLRDFNIDVEMQGANVGPRVTQFTLKPPAGVRLTKITALENNLALNLAATSIRMEAPIPGQRAVGIEVPNLKAASVRLHGVFDSTHWKTLNVPLGFAVGKDIAGQAVVQDLANMPHLLIAGATGSGKSVMINALLCSLLYRNSPATMKLVLVDPKQVELTPYHDIPHLLTPVITQPEKCISALKWAVAEMERRYTALSEAGKRNIGEYNKVKKEESMPYIVIVIDELADLMMMAARDVEALIVRLAQKARAVGIHLVLATQRPSVDVITGLIKANVPARIAFTVTSQVDSRTIIDSGGAEKLLGQGDMLLQIPSLAKPKRVQGVFIDDAEVNKITDFIRMERAPEYDDEVVAQQVQIGKGGVVSADDFDDEDSLFEDAVRTVIDSKKASASLLQRRLRVGYARAARLIESMEEQGIIGPADGARPRDVLITSFDDIGGGDDGTDVI